MSSEDHQNIVRRAAFGAAWVAIESVGTQIMSMAAFVVLAHYISPQEFGKISLAFMLIFSLKYTFFDSIATAVARKSVAADRDYNTAFWLTVSISGIVFLCLMIFSIFIDGLFGTPGLGDIVRAMAVIILIMGISRTQETWLLRNLQFRTLALRTLFATGIGGCIGIIFCVLKFGVWALVIQQVSTYSLAMCLLWATCQWRPSLHFSREVAVEIVAFIRGVTVNNVLAVINENIDLVLVTSFFGPNLLGLYAVSKRLAFAMQSITSEPINRVTLPALAELRPSDARFGNFANEGARIILIVCTPIFIGAAAAGPQLISLLLGERWLSSAYIFATLSIACLMASLVKYNMNIFISIGRTFYVSILTSVYTVVVLASFPIVKNAGINGVALPFLIATLSEAAMSYVMLIRLNVIGPLKLLKIAYAPLSAGALMYACLQMTGAYLNRGIVAQQLLEQVVLGAVVYCGLIVIFDKNTMKDITIFANIVGTKRRGT